MPVLSLLSHSVEEETRYTNIGMVSYRIRLWKSIINLLQNAPGSTDFADGNTYFAEGFATSIPAIINDGERTTIPASRTAPCLTFAGKLMKQCATRLFGTCIARVIGQMKQVAERKIDFMRWRRWCMRHVRMIGR